MATGTIARHRGAALIAIIVVFRSGFGAFVTTRPFTPTTVVSSRLGTTSTLAAHLDVATPAAQSLLGAPRCTQTMRRLKEFDADEAFLPAFDFYALLFTVGALMFAGLFVAPFVLYFNKSDEDEEDEEDFDDEDLLDEDGEDVVDIAETTAKPTEEKQVVEATAAVKQEVEATAAVPVKT
eukprot:CAMPEP_0117498274 /NCGR_PEP_ID=MMETSP0784-20121206/21628_1 /TAXON_ID=39447 /ORGANISM="" /LENGTH=179 /DNA_ID=CAMNT_0005293351 /DNA_START=86 /DNA_END=625 /DNA_ORIENTATION=+